MSKPLNVPQMLTQALVLHQQGRLTEAEMRRSLPCGRIISMFCICGVLKLAQGQASETLRLMASAMPPLPQILLNYGLVLNALDRRAEALESFDLRSSAKRNTRKPMSIARHCLPSSAATKKRSTDAARPMPWRNRPRRLRHASR
jgi:hypothetical protein